MIGLSHIAMNLALCGAITRQGPDTPVDVRVRLINRIDKPNFDKTYHFARGYANAKMINFNAPFGVYALVIDAPKYHCSGFDWVLFIPNHDRTMNESLVDGTAPVPHPMLMVGTLSSAFSYTNPTVAIFDKSQKCNAPVGDPLPLKTAVEYDQNSFYVWMYPDASLIPHAPVVVSVQIGAADGDSHFVRLKVPFPEPWHGFPDTWQFNITDNVIDGLATQKTETLLCPRLYETRVG